MGCSVTFRAVRTLQLTAMLSFLLLTVGSPCASQTTAALDDPLAGLGNLGLEAVTRALDGRLLAAAIEAARDDAVKRGVAPIPERLRRRLAPFIAAEVLDAARWRVGTGNAATLSTLALGSGHAVAITLGHVVVFRDQRAALDDAPLWAHELTHVAQYRRWGIQEFARRYQADSAGVEREALAVEARVRAALDGRPPASR